MDKEILDMIEYVPGVSGGRQRGVGWLIEAQKPQKATTRRIEVATRPKPDEETAKKLKSAKDKREKEKAWKQQRLEDERLKKKMDQELREKAIKRKKEEEKEKALKKKKKADRKRAIEKKIEEERKALSKKKREGESVPKAKKMKKSNNENTDTDSGISSAGFSQKSSSSSTKECVLDEQFQLFKVATESLLPFLHKERQKQEKKDMKTKEKEENKKTDKIDKCAQAVVACRKFGFRVCNRTPSGRDVRGVCAACGKDYSSLGSHLTVHKKKHDLDKLKSFHDAHFTRGLRGPLHLPTIVNAIVDAKGDRGIIEKIVKNAFALTGTGHSSNSDKCVPFYDTQVCFLDKHTLPRDPVNEADLEMHTIDAEERGKVVVIENETVPEHAASSSSSSSSDSSSDDSSASDDNGDDNDDYYDSITF